MEVIKNRNILELELNDGLGWKTSDLNFLKELDHLKSITIIDFGIKNIEPIHYLKNLEELNISTYCDTVIDFNVFPLLKECSLEWRKGCESIFDCSSLQTLMINKYLSNEKDVFDKLYNLETLVLLNSNLKNFEKVNKLLKLRSITLGRLKNLNSLNWMKELLQLEEVVIQDCNKIDSIEPLFDLEKLIRIHVINCGKVSSICGVEKLNLLEEFLFYESTNILDGDLNPLKKLKNLKKVSFQNRRHYNHKVQSFYLN